MPEITDRLFRLMSILCSAYGDDGHIEFKIKTLAKLMGGKTERAVGRIIDQARSKGLITTKQTGRSLIFYLSEKCFNSKPKLSSQKGQKCPVSYKEQKKGLKESSAEIPPDPPPSPPPKPLTAATAADAILIAGKITGGKKMIKDGIDKYGVEYVCELIKYAHEKYPDGMGGAIRMGLKERWESVDRRIKERKAIESKIIAEEDNLKKAFKEQQEAKQYFEATDPEQNDNTESKLMFKSLSDEEKKQIKIDYCKLKKWNELKQHRFLRQDDDNILRRFGFVDFIEGVLPCSN